MDVSTYLLEGLPFFVGEATHVTDNAAECGASSARAAASSFRLKMVPLTIVIKLRYHLDSCASTNKSQNSMGGSGLKAVIGVLDTIQVLSMHLYEEGALRTNSSHFVASNGTTTHISKLHLLERELRSLKKTN